VVKEGQTKNIDGEPFAKAGVSPACCGAVFVTVQLFQKKMGRSVPSAPAASTHFCVMWNTYMKGMRTA
jgi:hypothetical protein